MDMVLAAAGVAKLVRKPRSRAVASVFRPVQMMETARLRWQEHRGSVRRRWLLHRNWAERYRPVIPVGAGNQEVTEPSSGRFRKLEITDEVTRHHAASAEAKAVVDEQRYSGITAWNAAGDLNLRRIRCLPYRRPLAEKMNILYLTPVALRYC